MRVGKTWFGSDLFGREGDTLECSVFECVCIIMAKCQTGYDDKPGSSKDFELPKMTEKEEEIMKMRDEIRELRDEVRSLKSDMEEVKSEMSGMDATIEAKIEVKMGGDEWWNEEDQPPAVIRLSNWTKTQLRG